MQISARLRTRANPVMIKELRSRMRGPRAFAVLAGFLFLLGAFAYSLYALLAANQGFSNGMPGAVIGRSLFIGLAFFELVLVCIITPALPPAP